MNIRQIQARYDEVNDRVLLRFATADDCEFAFWLTRRFIRGFWRLLLKALEHDDPVRRQSDRETRKTVLGMRHEGFVRQSDFATPFDEREYRRPLGAEPLLVGRADYKPGAADGVFSLSLQPLAGSGVDLGLDASNLHSLCKLLRDAVARSDWDIELVMPGSEAQAALEAGTAPRTLN